MQNQTCSSEELRKLAPLSEVPAEQLQWLADAGECRDVLEGDIIIGLGDRFVSTLFILRGRYDVSFQQGKQLNEVEIVERGHILGYLPYSRAAVSIIRVVCIVPGVLLAVPAAEIVRVTKIHFELTAALVHFMLSRIRFATTQQQQLEKMAALGKLSAGLAHELNNPAAAIVRNASVLRDLFGNVPELFGLSAALGLSEAQVVNVRAALLSVLGRERKAPLTMMEASSREADVESWLNGRGLAMFSLSETLVAAGFVPEDLDDLIRGLDTGQEGRLMSWLDYHLSAGRITGEIEQASSRVSELVGAVKSFSHMDRGIDKEWVDVHAGIESTLILLDYKLRQEGVTVIRRYSAGLPKIPAFPGQLNQVWTNLIDNAIDAMSVNRGGTLTIGTVREHGSVLVSVEDDGPGIPADVLPRIFDPFFTTKRIGQGTGLGLEVVSKIVQQHQGTINVESMPGRTCFVLSLPIDLKKT